MRHLLTAPYSPTTTGKVERFHKTLRAGCLTGRVFAVKGATAEALYHFEKANRLRPGYGPHLYDYALMLTKVSRFDEAQQSAEAAIAANPDQAEAHAHPSSGPSSKIDVPSLAVPGKSVGH